MLSPEQTPNVHAQLNRNLSDPNANLGHLLNVSARGAVVALVAGAAVKSFNTVPIAYGAETPAAEIVVTTPGKPDVNQPLGGEAISAEQYISPVETAADSSEAQLKAFNKYIKNGLQGFFPAFPKAQVSLQGIVYTRKTKPQVQKDITAVGYQTPAFPEEVMQTFSDRTNAMVFRNGFSKRTWVGQGPVIEMALSENPNVKAQLGIIAETMSAETGEKVLPSTVYAKFLDKTLDSGNTTDLNLLAEQESIAIRATLSAYSPRVQRRHRGGKAHRGVVL